MSNAIVDRNLLFGVLALQMDFITRDALIDSLRDWTTQKCKPLGQILVERGDLSAARRELLEPLVDEHVWQHDQDPAASLASVSSISDGTIDWQRIEDVEIQDSLDARRMARDAAGTGDKSDLKADGASGRLERFRILRPHARGGIGEVFLAFDEELHREVALKEIQSRHLRDDSYRKRFVREAEVTGGLEHPGIVPVYSLGHHRDGRPFYAMRFIRGDSLKEAIERFHAHPKPPAPVAIRDDMNTPTVIGAAPLEPPAAAPTPGQREHLVSREQFESVEFRKLLGRFIDVCQAIEYAHSRGVLHRDLKPGNIMLGKYGETLVVDWGLARAAGKDERFANTDEDTLLPSSSGSGSELTQMGKAIGTLGYMSPEQAAGKLDQLGPATDVYSLGATLYHLLTGQSPMTAQPRRLGEAQAAVPRRQSVQEILQRIERAEFNSPQEVNPHVPRSLAAICLKAMALQPEHRYETSAAIAEDIEHWLADESVTAHRETLFATALRWVRKHRAWAMSGAAALVLVAVVSSVAAVWINSARGKVVTAESRASARYRDARQAVDDFFSTVANSAELTSTPGTHKLRRSLVERAGKYYERFLNDAGNDPELRETRARVLLQLALVSEQLAPGAETLALFERAAKAIEPLLREQPRQQDLRVLMAKAYRNWGELLLELNDAQTGLATHQKALTILEALHQERPDDDELTHELADLYDARGILLQKNGLPRDAVGPHQFANVLKEKLLAKNPKSAELRRSLSINLNGIGLLNDALQDPVGALKQLERARDLLESLGAEDVEAHDSFMLATVLGNLATRYRKAGEGLKARTALERSLVLLEQLVRENPLQADYEYRLASHYESTGALLGAERKLPEQLQTYGKAVAVFEKLLRANSNNAEYANGAAQVYISLGLAHRNAERFEPADVALRRAADLFERLTAKPGAEPAFSVSLGGVYLRLASLGIRQQQPEAALPWTDKAIAVLQSLPAEAGRTDKNRSAYLMDAHWSRAEAFELLKRFPEAAKEWATAIELDPKYSYESLRHKRANALRLAGELKQATALADEFAQRPGVTSGEIYDAACLYSLASGSAAKDERLGARERTALAARYADRACAWLKQAENAKYFDQPQQVEHLKGDTDIDPIRQHPEYRQLLMRLDAGSKSEATERVLRKSADTQKQKWGPDSQQYAGALIPLGVNLIAQRKDKDGTEVLSAAAAIIEKNPGRKTIEYGVLLAEWSAVLLETKQFELAEPHLRECLTIRQAVAPDLWSTFNAQSLLGASLMGQQKFAEAEPLLVAGFEGLKSREAQGKIPTAARPRLPNAAQRLIDLYTAWKKTEQASEWKKKLDELTPVKDKK